MLVGEAPTRWWSGTTFSFLRLGLISKKQALSLSLAIFRKGLQVLPWCNALSRGSGILLTPFILLSGRWQWLLTTSTAWSALAWKGPSSTWMACRASS